MDGANKYQYSLVSRRQYIGSSSIHSLACDLSRFFCSTASTVSHIEKLASRASNRMIPVAWEMSAILKKIIMHRLKIVGGFSLIFIGILGFFIPFLPGIPLILGGAAIVGMEHPWIRPFKQKYDRWRPSQKVDENA